MNQIVKNGEEMLNPDPKYDLKILLKIAKSNFVMRAII